MPGARDALRRFRPVGAPGAAAGRGVPADRVAELSAELGPLLALLADAQAEAAGRLQDAEDYAARRAAEAAADAEAITSQGRRRAEERRAAVADGAGRRGREERAASMAAARREADEIGRRSTERLPELVERVRRLVLAELAAVGAGPELLSPGPVGQGDR